jgi:hypothetical protein
VGSGTDPESVPAGESSWEPEGRGEDDAEGPVPRRDRRPRDPPGAQDYTAPLVIFLIVGGSFLLGLLILAFSMAFG